MGSRSRNLRWSVERRLEFIEFKLFWEGSINRADLIDFFGVSVPQASKDLSLYQERAPHNLHYDKSAKRYVPSAKFKPRFLTPDADQYLMELRTVAEHIAEDDQSWLSVLPDVGWMPVPQRRVDASVLRGLLAAIREERALEILYQSMNPQRPEPVWRTISPHAFGNDGLRWHVRAFCHIDQKFKDFLLSRCLDCRKSGHPREKPGNDKQWHQKIELKLIPNPNLSDSQRNVIASDYTMHDGELVISIRMALLYYFQKRLRLDVAEALDKPQEAPVVVSDKAAFDKVLAEATA